MQGETEIDIALYRGSRAMIRGMTNEMKILAVERAEEAETTVTTMATTAIALTIPTLTTTTSATGDSMIATPRAMMIATPHTMMIATSRTTAATTTFDISIEEVSSLTIDLRIRAASIREILVVQEGRFNDNSNHHSVTPLFDEMTLPFQIGSDLLLRL